MWPLRYFNPHYWAARYWNKAADEQTGKLCGELTTCNLLSGYVEVSPELTGTLEADNAIGGRFESLNRISGTLSASNSLSGQIIIDCCDC